MLAGRPRPLETPLARYDRRLGRRAIPADSLVIISEEGSSAKVQEPLERPTRGASVTVAVPDTSNAEIASDENGHFLCLNNSANIRDSLHSVPVSGSDRHLAAAESFSAAA